MYILQSSWRLPWSRIVAAFDASPTGYAVCVGNWLEQKVAGTGEFWNEAASSGTLGHPPAIPSFRLTLL